MWYTLRALLTSAIIAVVQALRENPDKYNIIFDNSKYDNNNKYHEGLVEIAKGVLKMLLNQLVDGCTSRRKLKMKRLFLCFRVKVYLIL
jgi:hypothetical protein